MTANYGRRLAKLVQNSPITPFVGNENDFLMPLLNEELARQGSDLRARVVQRMQWSELVIASANRQCVISVSSGSYRLVLFENERRLRAVSAADLAAAVGEARRWLRGEAIS